MTLSLSTMKCGTCKKQMLFEISIGSKFAFVCRQWDCKDMRTDQEVKALVQRMENMVKMEGMN